MEEYVNNLAERTKHEPAEGDYRDDEGFICCGKCNTRREAEIDNISGNGTFIVSVLCECRAEQVRQREENAKKEKHRQLVSRLREVGITDKRYLEFTFENDTLSDKSVRAICERYVKEWETNKRNNVGMLFTGGIGVGKTFMAGAIVNALIDKGISARIITMIKAGELLWDDKGAMQFIREPSLLVIDDFGAERGTEYGLEQSYNIINAREASGKPTIFTTNLTMQKLRNPASLEHERVYSRVLGMCDIVVNFEGADKRVVDFEQRQRKALENLGFGKEK